MMDYTKGQWAKYVCMHPFEGFEDLRWKKGGSMKIAWGVVVLLFIASLAYSRLYGFQYYSSYDRIFNIVPYIFKSFILFLTWVVANWPMCTLFDGEGTMKNIFINSAYALIPYVISSLLCTFLSHFLIRDEYIFIQTIQIIGECWTFILLVSGQKAVHQFTFGKTIALMLLTIVAMIAIIFLLVLLLTLFQQIIIFVLSIYTELTYRFRV